MVKEGCSIYEAVDLLNEALKLDAHVINALFRIRVTCNVKLAGHPTIQVMNIRPNFNIYMTGILGILNGLFGVDKDECGAIATIVNDYTGKIEKFTVLENRMEDKKDGK